MTIKIDHLKYKVKTKPKSGSTEFVELNIVFSVSSDDQMHDVFHQKVQDYSEKRLLISPERFEKESEGFLEYLIENGSSEGWPSSLDNYVTGFEHNDSILRYLPKFDKFQFHEFFSWCGLVQGAINDLRVLQHGYNPTRTTESCFLLSILEALEFHWD